MTSKWSARALAVMPCHAAGAKYSPPRERCVGIGPTGNAACCASWFVSASISRRIAASGLSHMRWPVGWSALRAGGENTLRSRPLFRMPSPSRPFLARSRPRTGASRRPMPGLVCRSVGRHRPNKTTETLDAVRGNRPRASGLQDACEKSWSRLPAGKQLFVSSSSYIEGSMSWNRIRPSWAGRAILVGMTAVGCRCAPLREHPSEPA